MTSSPSSRSRRRMTESGFSQAERSAMKERAQEWKAQNRRTDGLAAVLAKIAEMPEPERALARRIHDLITTHASALTPKTWYGMPAYADQDGKVVCFFQGAHKFNTRYATLGFTDAACLDDGLMWPVAFAIQGLTPEEETRIIALLKKATRQT